MSGGITDIDIQEISGNYFNKGYITSYYTIHDTLYDNDMDLSDSSSKIFNFTTGSALTIDETESGSKKYKLNPTKLFDPLKTYYTTETRTTPGSSSSYPIIVDVTPEGIISFRDNTGEPVSSAPALYSQICRLEADTKYDSKKNYYRVNSFGDNQNTNYTIKDNVIVFNNMHSTNTSISVNYTKYTRKHDKDKTYFHGAEDGLFMHENKKRSVANAMNEDIKVMIRQNEQMMVLGGITLATLVVGAYVILRN